jgi:hypothetical protein
MTPGKFRLHRRYQRCKHRFGDVGENLARPSAVERTAQELNTHLKPPIARPAPQRVKRVFVIA